jgi:hypothetical protein
MTDEANVILDLSDQAQSLLEQQDINLYREIQQACPSIRLSMQSDPEAAHGSRDIVQIITVTTGLIGTLTPIILQTLKLHTPPNRAVEWIIEEKEIHNADGSTTIYRKRVLSSNEQHQENKQADQAKANPFLSQETKE